jgi:hypothetical protein
MSFKKINPNKSYKTSELVNKINELNQALDKFVSAIDSRLSELDEKIENLEEERTVTIKAPKRALPQFIAKRVLIDGTLMGAIEDSASDIVNLKDSLDEDDDAAGLNFAIYKLVDEYKV